MVISLNIACCLTLSYFIHDEFVIIVPIVASTYILQYLIVGCLSRMGGNSFNIYYLTAVIDDRFTLGFPSIIITVIVFLLCINTVCPVISSHIRIAEHIIAVNIESSPYSFKRLEPLTVIIILTVNANACDTITSSVS